ncbi:MAG: hypothetical protein JNL13_02860 [Chitinophagaceae bacterium]|nr:hypothetical protein [Chitinophagaceae bacterium]
METAINKMKDIVTIFGRYTFPALTSLKKKGNGAYALRFEFSNLSDDELSNLNYLSSIRQPIPFSSEIVGAEYEINRFVIISHKAKEAAQKLIWTCHPFCSLMIQQFAT